MSIEEKAKAFKELHTPLQDDINSNTKDFKQLSKDLGLLATTPLQDMDGAATGNFEYAKKQSGLVDDSGDMLKSCSKSIVKEYAESIKVLGRAGSDYSEPFQFLTSNISNDLQNGVELDLDSVNNTMISGVLELWSDSVTQRKLESKRQRNMLRELRLENAELLKDSKWSARRWTTNLINKFRKDTSTEPPLNFDNFIVDVGVDSESKSDAKMVKEMEGHGCFDDFKDRADFKEVDGLSK
jgi:hypothetical protein